MIPSFAGCVWICANLNASDSPLVREVANRAGCTSGQCRDAVPTDYNEKRWLKAPATSSLASRELTRPGRAWREVRQPNYTVAPHRPSTDVLKTRNDQYANERGSLVTFPGKTVQPTRLGDTRLSRCVHAWRKPATRERSHWTAPERDERLKC